MIGFLTLGTNELERAAEFYDQLLAEMGAKRSSESERAVHWSTGDGATTLGVIKPHDGKAATVGNGMMVALAAGSREKVDALHAKAMSLGAANEGDPGPRGTGTFYGGYFRDLDGNKLVFYHR